MNQRIVRIYKTGKIQVTSYMQLRWMLISKLKKENLHYYFDRQLIKNIIV